MGAKVSAMQAIDDQVEQLAQGVGQTLGGLFGGARGMLQSGFTNAHRMVEEVTHHVQEAQGSPAGQSGHQLTAPKGAASAGRCS